MAGLNDQACGVLDLSSAAGYPDRALLVFELRLRADIAQYSPHVSKVPMGDIAWFSLI